MPSTTVLIPLPSVDFDPTEVCTSWKILKLSNIDVRFATADGLRAYADPVMISGEGLDAWGFIPLIKKIKIVGLLLRADKAARLNYLQLQQDSHFLNPIRFDQIDSEDYNGLLLPGGHAQGMRPFLEDKTLQNKVADFFEARGKKGKEKPIAAICHGVLLAARSISSTTGKSALYGLKTTALPWKFERKAWQLCKYYARFWDQYYYRTYQEEEHQELGYASVEYEVKRYLLYPTDFLDVTKNSNYYFSKSASIFRDSPQDERPAWLVRDGRYLSARWPGDVYTFAKTFVAMLREYDNN